MFLRFPFSFLVLPCLTLHAATPPELAALQQQYEKAVLAPFDSALADLKAKYLAGLERTIGEAKSAGKLEDILAIEAEKKRIDDKLPIPTTDDDKEPESLKKFRAIYRQQFDTLTASRDKTHADLLPPYTAKLQQLEATLVKNDRVDEAKEVLAYRQGLALAQSGPLIPLSGAPPEPGAPQPPPPAAASTHAPKIKGDDRMAAEWLVKAGAYVLIEERGNSFVPKKPEDLPKGRFSIKSLGLNGRDSKEPITDDAFPIFSGLQQLTSFSTDYLPVTDANLSFLARCPALQVLSIKRDAQITDAVVDHLVGLSDLRELRVTDVPTFTGSSLNKLANSQSIERLEFIATGFNDAGAAAIASHRKINSLTLEGSKQLTDAGLVHLSKLPALKHLSLCRAGCTAEGVAAAKLKVEHLDFNWLAGKRPSETAPIIGPAYPSVTSIRFAQSEGLTQEDFKALAHFKSLKAFSPLAIKDTTAWVGLASVPALTELWIDRNPFSDAEIAHLLAITNLTDLTLGTVDVTDAGLLKLAGLKKLKKLSLKPCAKVTEAGIATLKKQRPDIQISR